MDIVIRQGEDRDIPALFSLIKELAKFEKAENEVINSVDKMLKEKDHFEFFVAEKDNEVIGMALYFIAYYTWVGKSLYLDDLYVKKNYRGKKIGSKLLKEVFKAAEKENCNRIRWQVLTWNTEAINFYKKIDSKIDDQWLNCDFDRKGIQGFLKKLK
jgi:GNAT superfamily N-acetyltransferase